MLTKEQIKENCNLLIAFLDEPFDVEFKSDLKNDEWKKLNKHSVWDVNRFLHRRNPQPKKRLLCQDDIILGKSVVSPKTIPDIQYLIIFKELGRVKVIEDLKVSFISFDELKDDYLINHNNGIGEFLPCEVVIDG